ncbi:MAG: alcohol dehydrogenase [Deltaproteobacteria bacterium]|nr:MAG: alcohol dehydrogenase [Deltaproteobacteria bacterium]
MKAIRIHEPGDASRLSYESVPDPIAGPGQVLVEVVAASLNHLDIWLRGGLPGISFPLIPGADGAGRVVAVGPGVSSEHLEAEVLISPGWSCGRCAACLSGNDHYCPEYHILGENRNGTHAQRVVVPVENLIPKPKHLSFEEGAAIPLVFLTAWNMLVERAKVRPGEDVLILGAGSGVGSAGVQIARLFGARVIATVGREEKIPKAKALGADVVLDHTKIDVVAEVKRLTAKKGVEIVFEHPGAATWETSCRVLAHHGRLVTCGATTGFDVRIDLRHLFFRQLSFLGSTMGSKGSLLAMMPLFEDGRLRPVVDRVFPLEEARAAHAHVETRKVFGKVILKP